MCVSAPKTFLNRASCVRAPACNPTSFAAASVVLNHTTLRLFYTLSGRHLHSMENLRLEGAWAKSPCEGTSRWKRVRADGPCTASEETPLDDATAATLRTALRETADTANEMYRDMLKPSGECANKLDGVESRGARLSVDGSCWEHVHPHSGDVVDLTLWTQSHPGNANAIRAGRPNPITTFAKYGLSHMYFPSNHDMDRWRYGRIFMSTIGRIGDVISYADLPTATQSRATAAALGALADAEMGAASAGESCGSPGEVANEPIKGHRYAMWLYGDKLRDDPVYDRESPVLHTYPQIEGKSMVWLNIAFDADDQLRQRMAWALSQVFVIGVSGLDKEDQMEPWFAFYEYVLLRLDSPPHTGNRRRTRTRAFLLTVCH